jgi:uncharacterized protein YdeI (YjbR/CyaY-like superfamily)
MAGIQDAPLVPADDRATWRSWLEANHASSTGAWLVTWRKGHGPVLDYGEAVEEALCFGWVDSTGGKYDEHRTKLYFAPRKVRSVWSASNKERVVRLIADGRMRPAGLAAIERAKANGSWTALDAIEQGIVPPDLSAALEAHPRAAERFAAFPGPRDARSSSGSPMRRSPRRVRRASWRPRSAPRRTNAPTSGRATDGASAEAGRLPGVRRA